MLKRFSLSPRVDDEFATSDTRQMIKFVLSFLIKIFMGKLEKVISNSPLPTRSQKGKLTSFEPSFLRISGSVNVMSVSGVDR